MLVLMIDVLGLTVFAFTSGQNSESVLTVFENVTGTQRADISQTEETLNTNNVDTQTVQLNNEYGNTKEATGGLLGIFSKPFNWVMGCADTGITNSMVCENTVFRFFGAIVVWIVIIIHIGAVIEGYYMIRGKFS